MCDWCVENDISFKKSFFFLSKSRMNNDMLKVLNIALLSQISNKFRNLGLMGGRIDNSDDVQTVETDTIQNENSNENEEKQISLTTSEVNIILAGNISYYYRPSMGNILVSTTNKVTAVQHDGILREIEVPNHNSISNIDCGNNIFIDNKTAVYYISAGNNSNLIFTAAGESVVSAMRTDDTYDASIEDIIVVVQTSKRLVLVRYDKDSDTWKNTAITNVTTYDDIRLLPYGYFINGNHIYRIDTKSTVKISEIDIEKHKLINKVLNRPNTTIYLFRISNGVIEMIYKNASAWGYIHSTEGVIELPDIITNVYTVQDVICISTTNGCYKICNGCITKYTFICDKLPNTQPIMFFVSGVVYNNVIFHIYRQY